MRGFGLRMKSCKQTLMAFSMKLTSKSIAYISIALSIALTVWFLVFGNMIGGNIYSPDLVKIKNIQPFISGIAVPLITFGTSLLVIETFKNTTLQNISNNFFKLIDQNRRILDGVNYDSTHLLKGDIKSKGKDFFDDLCERISENYYVIINKEKEYLSDIDELLYNKIKDKVGKDLLIDIFDHYFHVHQSDLGHYFDNLYYIIKYIDSSKIRKQEKVDFVDLLRSQLSNYELLLLSYYGLHEYGKEFYSYIDEYHLLKRLNNEERLTSTYTKRIVDISILKQNYPHLRIYWT